MINTNMLTFIEQTWEDSIIPALMDYIKIPNKSPMFDRDWRKHGYMAQAVSLIAKWCEQQTIANMKVEVLEIENRTPLIYLEIPGTSEETILLYGHLDKQPEMVGWAPDLGPWQPVLKNERLYGRGAADDGYAAFASLTAILALQKEKIPHARCVILIEACEESGSLDLPFYIDYLQKRIKTPSLIVCLDSSCGNYEQLWSTTSLRGVIVCDLVIKILNEGVHSGTASGIVPTSFRILRQLLSRIEDENTGRMLLEEAHTEIPPQRFDQAKYAAQVLGNSIYTQFPFLPGVKPVTIDLTELILNRTWRPTLCITGADGFPTLESAGNVLRTKTALKLSIRLPPNCDVDRAAKALQQTLEKDPPYGAQVTVNLDATGLGWDAPILAPWLNQAAEEASLAYYGKPAAYWGEGGSIPFMGMLGKKFPQAQFLITGVLGPQSNAHGPNEFLHLTYAKKLTACVAHIIAKHFERIK